MHSLPAPLSTSRNQRGVTLVELMVSITLSFVVVLAATSLFVSSKSSYMSQESSSVLNDTGRYALENIARSVRQAGYEKWENSVNGGSAITLLPSMSANLSGLDDKSLKNDQTGGIGSTVSSVNGSDVLAVRFFGSGLAGNPDGTIVDCAGFAIDEPPQGETSGVSRGWSIYYIAKATDGVPELRCRRVAAAGGAWSSHAIARGVEAFQVLYGVDSLNTATDPVDRIPNRYMNATEVNALNAGIPAVDLNRRTAWKRVNSVKVALLISGPSNAGAQDNTATYSLFGPDYTNNNTDPGVSAAASSLTPSRSRKVFTTTIFFRNPMDGTKLEGSN